MLSIHTHRFGCGTRTSSQVGRFDLMTSSASPLLLMRVHWCTKSVEANESVTEEGTAAHDGGLVLRPATSFASQRNADLNQLTGSSQLGSWIEKSLVDTTIRPSRYSAGSTLTRPASLMCMATGTVPSGWADAGNDTTAGLASVRPPRSTLIPVPALRNPSGRVPAVADATVTRAAASSAPAGNSILTPPASTTVGVVASAMVTSTGADVDVSTTGVDDVVPTVVVCPPLAVVVTDLAVGLSPRAPLHAPVARTAERRMPTTRAHRLFMRSTYSGGRTLGSASAEPPGARARPRNWSPETIGARTRGSTTSFVATARRPLSGDGPPGHLLLGERRCDGRRSERMCPSVLEGRVGGP